MDKKDVAIITLGAVALSAITISVAQNQRIHRLVGNTKLYRNGIYTMVHIALHAIEYVDDPKDLAELKEKMDNEIKFFDITN